MKIQVMQGVLNPERMTVQDGDCSCDSPSKIPLKDGDCSCDAPAAKGAFQDQVSFVSYALVYSSQFTDTPTQPQPQKISSEFIPVKSIPAFSPNASPLHLYPILVPVAGASCWKTLSAWFHLTDRCNLRCDYCYLPHRPQDMSVDTGRAAVHALFRSAQTHAYTGVKIMYAGGEPLLRFPLILELHGYAQQLAEAQNIYLDEVVLSNGILLTPEMVQALKIRGIRLMISLDGLGTGHDAQRHFADGKGSFEKVSQAVELALEHGLPPSISITVTGRNAAGLAELVEWVLERGLIFQLNFYRQSLFSQSHADLQLEEQAILAGIQAALKVIEHHLPSFSLLGILDRTTLAYPHTLPCGAGADYLVFTPQGGIAQCQMLLHHPVTTVHDADPVSRIRADKSHFINPPVDERGECAECSWRYWCGGGCPLETRRVMHSPYHRSPNCRIYQTIFPELIRLEGLRLLHYASDPQVVRTKWLEFQPA